MVALVFAVLAAIVFLLAVLGVGIGSLNMIALGLLFLACAFVAAHLPARYNR